MKKLLNLASAVMSVALVASVSTVTFAASVNLNPTADTSLNFWGVNRGAEQIQMWNHYFVFDGIPYGFASEDPVLKFDLSGIAANSVINSATLILTKSGGGVAFDPNYSFNYEVYRMTSDWNEMEATYTQAKTGVNWATQVPNIAGAPVHYGDYAGTTGLRDVSPYATLPYNATVPAQFSFNVTSMVQEWVNGVNPNYGLKVNSVYYSAISCYSREATDPSLRPVLAIDYTVATVPEPGSMLAMLSGLVGVAGIYTRRRK